MAKRHRKRSKRRAGQRRSWVWATAALIGVVAAIATARLLAGDASKTADSRAAEPGGEHGIDRGTRHDAPVERLRVRVIRRYPHQRDAFTQGLVWHDGAVYESTGGEGRSSLRLVELETGDVLRRRDNEPSVFAEGLTLVGDLLYQITWRNGRALVFRRADFAPVREHSYEGEGWGLCYDGTSLVMSDGSDQLVFRDPASFAARRIVHVTLEGNPVTKLNELECAGGAVWANIWQKEAIVRIDPRDGRVTAVIDASGLLTAEERDRADVLNGIAWMPESGNFLITGKHWSWMFEVAFEPPAEAPTR
jgi:glutaminyl-peptide cyclotransferase